MDFLDDEAKGKNLDVSIAFAKLELLELGHGKRRFVDCPGIDQIAEHIRELKHPRPRSMWLQDLDHTVSDWDNDCLIFWGRVLDGGDAHWCHDWDGLPIDDTCEEYEACQCGGPD